MEDSKKALILLADGTEEMEFMITYDTLVRAGIHCTSAYVPSQTPLPPFTDNYHAPPYATGSRGVKIVLDVWLSPHWHDFAPEKYDLLVIPGGAKGAETMSSSSPVQHLVREYIKAGKYVGMICVGCLTALTSGLPSQPLTSHPSVEPDLSPYFEYSTSPVVISDHLITSRGPGTTFPFALTLVELLCGKEKRREVAGRMVFPDGTFA